MSQHISGAVFGCLMMLLVGTVFAGKPVSLPTVKLTDAAVTHAKHMLSEERDNRAVLSLIKGNFEGLDSAGNVKEKHSGWMLQVVDRKQFPNQPRQQIRGLEILFPQEHLYSELEGATLDFVNDWWVLTQHK